jgi:hypothetical protein
MTGTTRDDRPDARYDEQELDDLLQPTVPADARGPLPWNIRSQFFVAFFGGVVAITLIAWLNGERLRLPKSRQRAILLVGIAGILILVSTIFWLYGASIDRNGSVSRNAARVIGALVYLVQYTLQRDADRRHQVFGGGEYAALWRPGLAAVVAGWLFTVLVAFIALWTKGPS